MSLIFQGIHLADHLLFDYGAEQEITGDVLLELNPEVLKNEIGIAAFGKRVRISNAIAELRQPTLPLPTAPSSAPLPEPIHINTSTFPHPFPHPTHQLAHSQPPTVSSRSQSISYSHSHSHNGSSAQHSFTNSPLSGYGTVITPLSQQQFPTHSSSFAGNGNEFLNPPGSAATTNSGDGQGMGLGGPWRVSDPGSIVFSSSADTAQTQTQVGLGIGIPSTNGKSQVRFLSFSHAFFGG